MFHGVGRIEHSGRPWLLRGGSDDPVNVSRQQSYTGGQNAGANVVAYAHVWIMLTCMLDNLAGGQL